VRVHGVEGPDDERMADVLQERRPVDLDRQVSVRAGEHAGHLVLADAARAQHAVDAAHDLGSQRVRTVEGARLSVRYHRSSVRCRRDFGDGRRAPIGGSFARFVDGAATGRG
jgi:hypothetical protein